MSTLLHVGHVTSEAIFAPVIDLAASRFASALRVPTHFLVQVFAIEDKRFLIHPGVDLIATLRATIAMLTGAGRLQGASTITQQLYDAHRELRGLPRKRTLARKFRQAAWALAEDVRKSKQEILSDYLRIGYWGRSYYGLDAAAGLLSDHKRAAFYSPEFLPC